MDEAYAPGLMAEYLAGPGFDGWFAWINQQIRQLADECPTCGGTHDLSPADASAVRENLERFARVMK
jgi:hypothetical protein